MNFSFLALLAIVASASAEQLHPREYYEQMFFDHIQQFKLDFADGKEFLKRLDIFAKNVDAIDSHNADKTQTYTLGVNQFSHLTFEEFVQEAHIGGTRPPQLRRGPADEFHAAPADASANPTSVDWTTQGVVGPVHNQGSCGSCWAFSAIGAVESASKITYGKLYDLSEQHLVSCDTTDLGCNGGWMDDAFTWMKQNGGIGSEADYPYTSGSGQTGTCKKGVSSQPNTAPKSFVDVQTGSVTALESAVAIKPVSIAIQANQAAFQSYKSGVLTGKCGQRLDHGVLLVGYGYDTASKLNYWKVKNSWGTTWGEAGYIRILKDNSDLCGVLDAPSYPNV